MRTPRKKPAAVFAGLCITATCAVAPTSMGDVTCPDGSTAVNDRGTKTCTVAEPVGNSGNTKTTETSQKGSFSSSHPEDRTFTNPGGNQPPGQQ